MTVVGSSHAFYEECLISTSVSSTPVPPRSVAHTSRCIGVPSSGQHHLAPHRTRSLVAGRDAHGAAGGARTTHSTLARSSVGSLTPPKPPADLYARPSS